MWPNLVGGSRRHKSRVAWPGSLASAVHDGLADCAVAPAREPSLRLTHLPLWPATRLAERRVDRIADCGTVPGDEFLDLDLVRGGVEGEPPQLVLAGHGAVRLADEAVVAFHYTVCLRRRTVAPDLASQVVLCEPDPKLERAVRLVGEAQVDVVVEHG